MLLLTVRLMTVSARELLVVVHGLVDAKLSRD